MLIIADIAGQFDALERLAKHAPKGEPIILLGDLVDRGHESFEVIEWAMCTPNVITLLGNHEHMMLDYYRPKIKYGIYPPGCWEANGGHNTRASYRRNGHAVPPDSHLDWLETLSPCLASNKEKLFMSHAPLHRNREVSEALEINNPLSADFDRSLIWNRSEPRRREWFQVFGHNSHWGLRKLSDDEGDFALCIDQSQRSILTGFHWPTMEIFEEPYLRTSPKELTL